MRAFTKGPEPIAFATWKAQANDDWSPDYTNLRSPEKGLLHQSLLSEQCYCCCYCGRDIELGNSHVEHFRPQSEYKDLELDYQNLHASCIRNKDPETPLHCGHAKGDWFDEAGHISPLDHASESRYRYLLIGKIEASILGDHAAERMIEKLSLDIAYLNNRRSEALAGIFDNDFLSDSTPDELRRIVIAVRSPNEGRLTPFSHVIARFAEQQLGQ